MVTETDDVPGGMVMFRVHNLGLGRLYAPKLLTSCGAVLETLYYNVFLCLYSLGNHSSDSVTYFTIHAQAENPWDLACGVVLLPINFFCSVDSMSL